MNDDTGSQLAAIAAALTEQDHVWEHAKRTLRSMAADTAIVVPAEILEAIDEAAQRTQAGPCVSQTNAIRA